MILAISTQFSVLHPSVFLHNDWMPFREMGLGQGSWMNYDGLRGAGVWALSIPSKFSEWMQFI